MVNEKSKRVVRGATALGAGAFISKVIGAIYRIPLTNLLGGSGIGLYQTVFPLYALLLDFSGCGVPSAISKIIAQCDLEKERKAREYLFGSLRLLLIFGAAFSAFMFALAKPIARLQGNPDAYLGYIFLSPAILLVSVISCFRGYFQGLLKMAPTAISQIIEQLVKLSLGLVVVKLLLPNIPKAVAGATFAITVSELVALGYLFITYNKRKNALGINFPLDRYALKKSYPLILKTTLPITLVGIMIPLSQVIDSFLTVNIIGSYRADATALYGLLSGVAMTVVNLPVSVCHGIATVAIPTVSAEKSKEKQNESAAKTLIITVAASLPCALFCLAFSPFIVNFLYRSLPSSEKTVAINLLRILSPCVLFLSVLQTLNAILIGKGKLYSPVFSLGVATVIKTVLNIILLNVSQINIYGGAVALNACYFCAGLINLFMIFKFKVKNGNPRAYRREYAS